MAREKDILALLATAKLRRTPVRYGVLRHLGKADKPLSAQELLARLPEATDTVTVYRTINTFVRKHMVQRVRGDDRTWRYELSHGHEAAHGLHPHFVCRECNRVLCIKEATLPAKFVPNLRLGAAYQVDYAEVVLHGICPSCQR